MLRCPLWQYCLSTAASQPIEAVAEANEQGASVRNESNSVHQYNGELIYGMADGISDLSYPGWEGLNGGNATSPRFFQLYMGHDDEVVSTYTYSKIVDDLRLYLDPVSAQPSLEERI